ncbi:MAG TPA: IMP dehydrogenase [Candidatus Saccharimonadales bacterium]|nr:IMP dehydrogenase [Candidatus Saccharimonadales bacterium]
MAEKVKDVFKYLDENHRSIAFDEFTITDERTAEFDRDDVSMAGRLSRRIGAPNPILTSPMTTVTEDEMGIAAAKAGGAGVIHCANTPDEQKKLLTKVKFHLNGIVDRPILASADKTVGETLEELDNAGHDFRSLPVTDENGRFMGLMTNTVFEFYKGDDSHTPIAKAMIPADQVPTASSDIRDDPHAAYDAMRHYKIKLLPLLDENYRVDGLYLLDDVQRAIEGNPRGYNLDASGRLITAMAVSTWSRDAMERIQESGKYLDLVVIDTSHGESKYTFSAVKAMRQAIRLVKNLREEYGAIDIMVGNVSDPEPAVALVKAGADAIRVGRGPGGICISREKLGGGTPQASAIYNCAKAVRKIDKKVAICADGGIRGPGDMVKALLLGANCVMVGGLVAATDEAAAEVMRRADGTEYKEYNGMGSAKELRRSWAARLRYDPSFEAPNLDDDDIRVRVEGVEKELPLRGPVAPIFREMAYDVTTEMYNGAFKKLKQLRKGGHITLTGQAGLLEGRASSS